MYDFETILIHGENNPAKNQQATVTPIYQTTSFKYEKCEDISNVFRGEKFGYIYTRISNPTIETLERRMTLLEDGIGAIATSSGMAAITSTILTLCKNGDNFISSSSIFGGTYSLFKKRLKEFGINCKLVDPTDIEGFEKNIDDKTKAIFYYIADERVDFRQLIKILAEEFKVRIEMRQIGARQEAGRIGGIGSCGRELCCSTFITNFSSVTTTHARYQELTLNPQKLAGQCGKLKCCLSYEFDCYVDAQKNFPPRDVPLELADRTLYFQKMEVHKAIYWYSREQNTAMNLISIPVDRVREIQEMNKQGIKPDFLFVAQEPWNEETPSGDLLDGNSITRFDRQQTVQEKNKQQRELQNRKHKKEHDRKNQ